jgi:peptide/nickel transport system substrate-binding protein
MTDLENTIKDLEDGRLSRKAFVGKALALGISPAVIGTLLAAYAGSPASVLAAHVDEFSAAPSSVPSGRIVFGNAEPPTSAYWDPASAFGLVDEQVASLVHETLFTYNAAGRLVPRLASHWYRVSPTRLHVTLRAGARFQNGAPVTAADVKASVDRLGKVKSPLAKSIMFAPMHARIIDQHNLEIVTNKPYGPLVHALVVLYILPQADINNPNNFKKRAMGAGPYRFVSYKGTKVTLEANMNYWGPKPHIKTVVFDYIQDWNARTDALLTGSIDVMTRVSSIQLDRVRGNKQFYVTRISPPGEIVSLYQHTGPLKDVRVRQALAYAIDRQGIAQHILKVDPIQYSSLPSNCPGYRAMGQKFAYNPAKAKELLAAAGHSSGLTLSMATASLVPHQEEIDQLIAQYLQAVGVKVNITRLEVGAFRSTYNHYDLSLNTLVTFDNDPDFIFGVYQGATAKAVFHLEDAKIPQMVSRQREAVGPSRQRAVNQLQQYLWNQQENLFLTDEIWYTIVSSRIKNYHRAPLVGEPLVPMARHA